MKITHPICKYIQSKVPLALRTTMYNFKLQRFNPLTARINRSSVSLLWTVVVTRTSPPPFPIPCATSALCCGGLEMPEDSQCASKELLYGDSQLKGKTQSQGCKAAVKSSTSRSRQPGRWLGGENAWIVLGCGSLVHCLPPGECQWSATYAVFNTPYGRPNVFLLPWGKQTVSCFATEASKDLRRDQTPPFNKRQWMTDNQTEFAQ